MASRKLEERIEQLKRLRSSGPDAAAALQRGLEDRSNLVVAEAAKIAAELRLTSLIPSLLAAFDRLLEDPVKTDPKCWGKTSIIKALTDLDYAESPPFLRALRHIQMEAVWGGSEDAAGLLRANAALALVQCTDLRRGDVLRHLTDALADSLHPVRIEAVRALEQMNGEESAVLLRLKAHCGDQAPTVMGQVFDSLLALEREKAVEFVAQFMTSGDADARDEAALSLGASRLPAAVHVLTETWRRTKSLEFGAVLLRALSSSRQPTALDFLLNLISNGRERDAAAALEALQIHRDSPEILARVEEARKQREGFTRIEPH